MKHLSIESAGVVAKVTGWMVGTIGFSVSLANNFNAESMLYVIGSCFAIAVAVLCGCIWSVGRSMEGRSLNLISQVRGDSVVVAQECEGEQYVWGSK